MQISRRTEHARFTILWSDWFYRLLPLIIGSGCNYRSRGFWNFLHKPPESTTAWYRFFSPENSVYKKRQSILINVFLYISTSLNAWTAPCFSAAPIKSRNFSLLFPGRNFLNGKFCMIQLWPRILPSRNAKHRKNPVPFFFAPSASYKCLVLY